MKKLLILTDFSATANHAALYGYRLAIQLKADIILCNAAIVASDIPLAGLASWPLEERDTYLQNSQEEITLLKAHLESGNHTGKYQPTMTFVSDPGSLIHVLDDTLDQTQVDLVVMGTHSGDQVHTFLFDSPCMNMIKTAHKPLLMIPSAAKFSAIKNINFITDIKNCNSDLKFIAQILLLAKQLESGLTVSCLDEGSKETSLEFELRMNNALLKLSNEKHPHINYTMKHSGQIKVLAGLYERDETDILVVINRPDNFFDQLLHERETTTLENQISVPLLVIKG